MSENLKSHLRAAAFAATPVLVGLALAWPWHDRPRRQEADGRNETTRRPDVAARGPEDSSWKR